MSNSKDFIHKHIGTPPQHSWTGTSVKFQQKDGTFGTAVNHKGNQGPPGDKGATGDQGPKGIQGPAG